MTAHTFWKMQPELANARAELMDGEILRKPFLSMWESHCVAELILNVGSFARAHRSGICLSATGFRLDAHTVLSPRLAFIDAARSHKKRSILLDARKHDRFVSVAPNLAIEVLTSSDCLREMKDKIKTWLAFGVDAVWVIYPKTEEVHVHAKSRRTRIFTSADMFEGGEVLPGFSYPLKKLFAPEIFDS